MSSNICGNCDNFRPGRGEKFFNCTKALHAGVKYGMQVRADTKSCDAFEPLKAATPPKPTPKPTPIPAPTTKRARPRRVGLCPWGRLILIVAVVVFILLLSWLVYTCASKSMSGPTPTPTPTPIPGPTPTPMPAYIYQDFEIGKWLIVADRAVLLHSVGRSTTYGASAAPAGTVFVWFQLTITNMGTESFTISPGTFWLNDSLEYLYGPADYPYYYSWRYDPPTVYGGSTVNGEILYLIPDFSTGLYVNYVIQPYSVPPLVARWKLPW